MLRGGQIDDGEILGGDGDLYGFKITNNDGQLCLVLDRENKAYLSMFDIFNAWSAESEKFKNGEITKEEYDDWRYSYPRIEAERTKERLDTLKAEKELTPNEK